MKMINSTAQLVRIFPFVFVFIFTSLRSPGENKNRHPEILAENPGLHSYQGSRLDPSFGVRLNKHDGFTLTGTITITGALAAFVTCKGVASGEQSFIIAGTSLTGNIIITAPAGFEISTTAGTGFAESVSLTPSGGSINNTPIYVRVSNIATSTSSGNITCSSAGATTKNITVTGIINILPTVNQPANIDVCGTASPIVFSGLVPGTVYNWTNNNPAIGLAASGTGNIPSFTPINSSNVPITATITVSPSAPSPGKAYVTNFSNTQYVPGSVSVINTESSSLITDIQIGGQFLGVSVSSNGKLAYIGDWSRKIWVINTVTDVVEASVRVESSPSGIAVSPDGSRLYAAIYGNHYLAVINTGTGEIIIGIPVGQYPYGVAVSPDGRKVYVANTQSSNVSVINTITNVLETNIPVSSIGRYGSSPFGIAITPDGSKIYVTNSYNNNVSVINPATNTIVATIDVGNRPRGVSVSPDGSRVYVANYASNNLSVINTSNNAVIATVPVIESPYGVSVTPDGSHVYVVNEGYGHVRRGSVSVILAATNTNVTTITSGIGYQAAGFGNFITASGPPVCQGTSKTFTITVPSAPTIMAPTVTHFTCALKSGTIVVNAAGAGCTLEYSIDNGSSWRLSPVFSGLAHGNYYIKSRYQNKPGSATAYSSNPVVINVLPNPPTIFRVTATQPTCALPKGSISVLALGDQLEYSNNSGSTWQPSSTFGDLAAGNYNIKIRLRNNPTCIANYNSGPVIIDVLPLTPTIALATPNTQTKCSGIAITKIALSSNVNGTVYNWTRDNTVTITGIPNSGTGDINGTFTNITNAPITVTFRITPITGGCPGAMITSTVLVNPQPIVSGIVTQPTSCNIANGAISLTIDGTPGPYNFAWTGTLVTPGNKNQANLPVGNYSVAVTGANGCTSISKFRLLFPCN